MGIEEDDDDGDIYNSDVMSSYDSMLVDEPENYHQHTGSKSMSYEYKVVLRWLLAHLNEFFLDFRII